MAEHITLSRKGNYWVLVFCIAFSFVAVFMIERQVLVQTGGVFSYPVDDVYIHMELAKNLAFHNTWGINPGEFGSASSSPFYTVLLAFLFRIFSNNIYIPFIVNCIAGLLLLIVAWRWLGKQNIGSLSQFLVLMAVVFFMPLPVLIISGMEHTLQCLFSFLFLFSFADWFQKLLANEKLKLPWQMALYGMLTATVRYEGLFLVGMACLFLLFHKKIRHAFVLGFVVLFPLVVFGVYSLSKGSYALPNSVLVKSGAAQFSGSGMAGAIGNILVERLTFSKAGITLLATQRLLFILPLCYFVFRKYLTGQAGFRFLLIALTGAYFLQLALADTGKFYRYEAYLVVCSVVTVGVLIARHGKEYLEQNAGILKWLMAFVVFFLALPLILRSTAAFSKAGRACVNIYEQQYQMGRFLQRYYNHETVAANDIGAVSYFSDGGVVDLWGLGNIEIARSRKKGYWTPDFVDSISRKKNVRLALVYDSWVGQVLPKQWKKVATWRIHNNVVCGDDFVSFYAVDSTRVTELKNNIENYRTILPATVDQVLY